MANDFELAQEHAKELKEQCSQRDADFEEYEKMFFLEDDDLPEHDHVKKTISPDARNTLLGAARLLSASAPEWSVPFESNNRNAKRQSDAIEKAAKAIWNACGRVNRKPLHYDLALMGLLYGEVHMAVYSVEDMMAVAGEGEKRRLEQVQMRTPLIIEPLNPKFGYPEYDVLGLKAFYSQKDMRVGDVLSRWGKKAEGQLAKRKLSEEVEYNEFWDSLYRYVWIGGEKEPLYEGEHKAPMLPIVAYITEGSNLFEEMEDTRQPFLYTLYKSGLWSRQNLAMTVLYTMTFAIGANTQFLYRRNSPDKKAPDTDWSAIGGTTMIDANEDFGPLAKQVLDPSILQAYEIAEAKIPESTIYKQALGESLGGNTPYSTVALLNQAGRLPLIPYQRMLSWAIGEAMYVGMQLLREQGGTVKAMGEKGAVELDTKEIPEAFDLQASLEVELPMDERVNAQIAMQVTSGENPLASMRYAREKFLKAGQSEEMQEEIWAERYANLEQTIDFQKALAKAQAEMQAALTPNPSPNMGEGTTTLTPESPPTPPPTASGMMPPGMGVPGGAPMGNVGLPSMPLPMEGPMETDGMGELPGVNGLRGEV